MFEACDLSKGCTDKRTRAEGDVFVRSPRRGGLTRVLTGMGATVLAEPGGGLSVTGLEAWLIAAAAASHWIPIQELTPRSVTIQPAARSILMPSPNDGMSISR